MAEIVISEFMDEAAVTTLRGDHEVLFDPALADDRARLLSVLGEARALIVRNRTRVDAELLAHAPSLVVVGRLGVGLDNIDLEACEDRAIAVHPATGANDQAVAEYVITAAALLLRGAYGATARVLDGEWPRQALVGREMAGKLMGLVGLGAIARQVGARARAMGMITAAYDPHLKRQENAWEDVRYRSLEELLEEADVLSLHVPLLPSTRRLIDGAALARMKQGAVLINTARGGIVDEEALARALREGRLAGAALDVFESEPLDASTAKRFEGCSNLLLTPHIAGVTVESNVRVSALIARKVAQALKA